MCSGEIPHFFCLQCAKMYAENELGEMRFKLTCMDQSGCKASFQHREVRRFMDVKSIKRLEMLQQQDDLQRAGIEDLAECPFCDYKAIYPPIEVNREFSCNNPDCERVSCRLCREVTHIPISCEENKKDRKLPARHAVEEAMTASLIRECPNPKCKKKIVKELGCNKMTCVCRTVMCYTCRKDITKEGYEHFAKSPYCNMHEAVDPHVLHEQEVQKAQKAEIERQRKENPNLAEEDLEVEKEKAPSAASGGNPAMDQHIHQLYARHHAAIAPQIEAARAQVNARTQALAHARAQAHAKAYNAALALGGGNGREANGPNDPAMAPRLNEIGLQVMPGHGPLEIFSKCHHLMSWTYSKRSRGFEETDDATVDEDMAAAERQARFHLQRLPPIPAGDRRRARAGELVEQLLDVFRPHQAAEQNANAQPPPLPNLMQAYRDGVLNQNLLRDLLGPDLAAARGQAPITEEQIRQRRQERDLNDRHHVAMRQRLQQARIQEERARRLARNRDERNGNAQATGIPNPVRMNIENSTAEPEAPQVPRTLGERNRGQQHALLAHNIVPILPPAMKWNRTPPNTQAAGRQTVGHENASAGPPQDRGAAQPTSSDIREQMTLLRSAQVNLRTQSAAEGQVQPPEGNGSPASTPLGRTRQRTRNEKHARRQGSIKEEP